MGVISASCGTRPGLRSFRVSRSAPPYWGSICWAMRFGTPWIRGRCAPRFPGEPDSPTSHVRDTSACRVVTFDIEALREREFPWAAKGEAVYLNNASTGPLPERALAAIRDFDERRAAPYRLSDELQFATLARGRELIARLIGAEPGEIALAVNTTYGLNLAAFSLPLSAGDVVLTPDREFPANVYPWMQLARRHGVIYRRIPLCNGAVDEEALRRELEDPAVKAVSVSWVGFSTGYTVDLEAI